MNDVDGAQKVGMRGILVKTGNIAICSVESVVSVISCVYNCVVLCREV